jgi:arylsulfatase A-like enzyme/lipopolysaccharide biosynthesis regulator YciM
MRRTALALALAIAVTAAVALLLERRFAAAPGPASPGERLNVLLVSIDTLRPDHLGCYGYAAAETPRLDALAASGLRFTQATTVLPLTLPAHSSLLTGTFPAHHGVRDNGGFYLGDGETTLAELLKANGYRTGGFVSAFVLDSRWGISQGFDTYYDDFDLAKYEGVGMDAIQRRGDETAAKAQEWLAEERARPFFAWVHLYDPHAPYAAPPEYAARFPATPVGAYDAEIAWSDSIVGRLLDGLAADGRLARTLIVVVGDHGESLGEHKEPTHGFFIYDATIRIPMLIAGPGIPAKVVPDPVRIVDVAPTILDRLGVAVPAVIQGASLLPLGRGQALTLAGLAESWYPRYHYGWSELEAIRDSRYKLIKAPRRELYDLHEDPHETDDIARRDPARADAMERALLAMRRRVQGAAATKGPQPVDPEVEERLEALGYVSGPVSARHLEDRPRGDPKDKIELYNLLKEAGGASVAGHLDVAIAKARQALASDATIVEAHMLLGNFLGKSKRYEEAIAAYREALALDPEHQGATFSLALAYKDSGKTKEAEAGFERARSLDPRASKPLWQLADLWMQSGEFDRAEGALKEALTRKVDRPSFLLKLAECQIEMKRYAEAEATLREALGAKPGMALAHYDLALVHEARGDLARAMQEYEAELAAHPKTFRASFNLAKLLLQAGRSEQAIGRFRDTVLASPEFAIGHLYLAKAYLDAGQLKDAEASARRGLSASPEKKVAPLGHYVLADVYTRAGRPRDAARELAAAHKLESGG